MIEGPADCKGCYNPHEGERRPQFLPWAMSLYVLNKHSDLSPPFHLTVDDVNMERIPTRSHQDPSLVTGFSEDFLER